LTNIYNIRPRGFNVGNEAIHVALRHRVNTAFGEPVNIINLPATSRYESSNKAGFTAATVHEINQYGDGVIVGGGNLYENGELDVDLAALKTLDVPMMLFSLSMGRIYNRRGELVRRTDSMRDEVIRGLHDQADLSLARDEATVRHLASAGAEAVLGGCPTLFISESPQHAIPQALETADVLLSVRTPELMSIPVTLRRRVTDDIRRIAEAVCERTGYTLKLLCHDHRDIPFASSFGDLEYVYTDDVYAYLSLLKSTKLNISYRLHSVLPCLSYGTPVIKVSYDERGLSVMDTIGLGDWNIDMLCEHDVAGAVLERYEHLERLEQLRVAATGRWAELHCVLDTTMDDFAGRVRDYQRRNADAIPHTPLAVAASDKVHA
jgi:polysaccharide pyruvyl transferase WcaK-like protein